VKYWEIIADNLSKAVWSSSDSRSPIFASQAVCRTITNSKGKVSHMVGMIQILTHLLAFYLVVKGFEIPTVDGATVDSNWLMRWSRI